MQDEDDATLTAQAILRALNAHREREKLFAVLVWTNEGRFEAAWGPYRSLKEAQADLEAGGVTTSRPGYAKLVGLATSREE